MSSSITQWSSEKCGITNKEILYITKWKILLNQRTAQYQVGWCLNTK